jgi:hypothetical protein
MYGIFGEGEAKRGPNQLWLLLEAQIWIGAAVARSAPPTPAHMGLRIRRFGGLSLSRPKNEADPIKLSLSR